MTRVSNYGRPRTLACGSAIFAVALLAALVQPAEAANPALQEFNIALAPSARLLDAWLTPDYYDVAYEEMCDNPILRTRARNAPAVRIDNNTSTLDPITTVTIKINEGPYIFGMGDGMNPGFQDFIKNTIYTDAGVLITSSSLSANKKELTVNFDGLAPGSKAIFYIDLDLDDADPDSAGMFPFPDYRNVLFGAPVSQGDPATQAGTATAIMGTAPNERVLPVNLGVATDAYGNAVANVLPAWQNDNIRPYAVQDPMELISTGIPEPASMLLAGLGAAAVTLVRRRAGRYAA